MPTKRELGWAAGIIDGEGCIRIDSSGGRYCVCLYLSMTHKETLEKFRKIVDSGEIKQYDRKRPNDKDIYTMYWISENAVKIIRLLQQDLVTKKLQAELAIEFQEKCFRGNIGRIEIPDDVRVLREVIYSEMRDLNRKGKS